MSPSRVLALAVTLFALAGCGGGTPNAVPVSLKTPADPLTPADLELFLAVVGARGDDAMPEFTPAGDDPDLDMRRPAAELASDYRTRFRDLFDAARQGRLWDDDDDWAAVFRKRQTTGPDFAALVRSVSCAVMRVRLESRVRIDRLVANARAEVQDLISTMDAIDTLPPAEQSPQDAFIRGQSALRLGRAVALQEFSQMIKQVPAENCQLVRQFSGRLKPLLPPGATDDLLSELHALGISRPVEIQQAGHTDDE